MNHHLTIDLDYFDFRYNTGLDSLVEEGLNFVSNIQKRFPCFVVESHDQILDHLNTHSFDRIINVDFHSDIANEPVEELNEGTWANFVKERRDMVFEWRFPNKYSCLIEGHGRCDDGVFTNRPIDRKKFGYRKVFFREGTERISLRKIKTVSICKSPEWTTGELEALLFG